MRPLLVFQTDFTYKEGAVGAMYGVVKSVDREIEIIDSTHEIPQYDTWSASYRLYQVAPYWPSGTIFVSVVDPGVGTARKACVAKTKNGIYIVTPDNGTLTHIYKHMGIEEVREIDEIRNRLIREDNKEVSIFHGRDLFGYCAAKLASGKISFEEVGPEYPVEDIVRHEITEGKIVEDRVEGIFEINDPNFGNLWTNIRLDTFKEAGFRFGDKIRTEIYKNDELVYSDVIDYFQSFSMAPNHSVMIYNNEINRIAMAEVVGNLTERYSLGFGPEYRVVFYRG